MLTAESSLNAENNDMTCDGNQEIVFAFVFIIVIVFVIVYVIVFVIVFV